MTDVAIAVKQREFDGAMSATRHAVEKTQKAPRASRGVLFAGLPHSRELARNRMDGLLAGDRFHLIRDVHLNRLQGRFMS
jgi:hypothetical protein